MNKHNHNQMELFRSGKASTAVLKNSIPAVIAMLMVLIYNVVDAFFVGQTHNDLQVAAVSICTPVFLLFLAVGTVFGEGGVSVISRAMGEGRVEYVRKVSAFCMWAKRRCYHVGLVLGLHGSNSDVDRCDQRRVDLCEALHDDCIIWRSFSYAFDLFLKCDSC